MDAIAAEGLDESGLPSEAYVPTAEGEHAPVPTEGYSSDGLAPGSGNQTVFDAGTG